MATGHAVHRAWCHACMTARGQVGRHERQEGAPEGADPVVCLDYGFMMPGEFADGEHPEEAELEDDEEDVKLPMIVAKDCRMVTYSATSVQKKGSTEQACKWLVSFLKHLGYRRLILQSDGEPSICALKEGGGHGEARWCGSDPSRVPGRGSSGQR